MIPADHCVIFSKKSLFSKNSLAERQISQTKLFCNSLRIEPGIKKTRTAKSTRPKRRTPKKKSSLANSVFKGLETEHIPLTLELLSKVRWTEKQVAKLAVKHGLMWQGSLEVINEWAFDTFGSELIEEYDGYQMNADTVGELSKRVQELKR